MHPFVEVMFLSLGPAGGALGGGLLGRWIGLSRLSLSFALHLAAGVVLGVVGVELMPRALEAEPVVVLVSFFAGGLFYIFTTRGSEWLVDHVPLGGIDSTTGAIIAGVGFDMLTDGMMIAAGEEIAGGLGLLLAVGLFIADAPEAFSTLASLRSQQLDRRLTLGVAWLFPALVLVGAPIGYFAVDGQPEEVQLGLLAFTAGMLVLVVIEGLVPEAHALTRRQSEKASTFFLTGFTAFAFISLYVG